MHPEHRSIGELAYRLWQARGCPDGSAEKDWLDAERQLRLDAEQRRGETPSSQINAPVETARPATQPAAKSPGTRPSRARALKPKSASSQSISVDSSKPGDAAG